MEWCYGAARRMSSSDEIDLDTKLPGAVLGSDGAAEIAKTAAVEPQATVEAATAASNRAIAEGLATGALDPVAAQQLLIDRVLAEQLPADLPPEQIERIRGELAALLEGDPNLFSLLQP